MVKLQRVAIICGAFIFLVAMAVAVDAAGSGAPTATAKAVQTICQPTDYKEACQRSLASAKTSDRKELMKLAFKAATDGFALALKTCTELEKVNKDSKTGQSLSVCNDELSSAVEKIQQSSDRIGAVVLIKVDDVIIGDVQTWLGMASSAGTMCLDSFEWNTPQSDAAKAHMEKALKPAKELISNALVMVNQLDKRPSIPGM
uniref:Pectinesterase inhibitor domain-containing protein n=1 Tax=Kalanchoe fedtschenkoi TaxID=63787 RepID=A0A7N0V2V0_KALFE